MFQFPGFALLTLCIQAKSTWFTPLLIARAINSRMSGGLPHSEIPGSKGALASPGLIAECHVLHRLLSPRHPPNALLALDPIQKRKDRSPLSCRKSYFPQRSQRLASEEPPSVSVLDLERLLSVVLPRFALLEDGSSHSSNPGRRTSIEPHWNDR